MLFELAGKRKRLIQVIYVCLAGLMFIALVGFGIGGATSGGIFDALGIGGSGTPSNPQYDQQIERAQQTLADKPNDEKALLLLARTNFLAAQAAVEVDDQGRQTITADALQDYQAATAAWERYLKTDPKQPDDSVAPLMIQAYIASASNAPTSLENDINQAFKAAQIVADARPSLGSDTQLASYAYLAGEDKIAAEAEQRALAAAPDSSTKSQIKAQFAQAKKQGAQIAQSLKQNAPDQSQLQDPLGGLGGSTSAVPGGPTSAP
jgi:tetratricopeptide (TPR) repeat protein